MRKYCIRADADFVEAKNISPSKPLSPLGKIGHYLGISSSNEDSSDFRYRTLITSNCYVLLFHILLLTRAPFVLALLLYSFSSPLYL